MTIEQPILLDIQHLSTHLRSGDAEVKAVDDVSFQIHRGETFCLVGESGSGKSVTALSVMQLLPRDAIVHTAGELLFQMSRDPNRQWKPIDLLKVMGRGSVKIRGSRIAMIFQEPMTSLNPVFTVGEQIIEALQLTWPQLTDDEAMERALQSLRDVQLDQVETRIHYYPHQLSGGQRQRVMIAMAMACEPDLLIADEPTTALDVTVQAEILKLMRGLQKRTGMSILFITHDFGVVAKMAHRLGVMKQGKIVECGPLRQVLGKPQHEYTRTLLTSLPENLRETRPYIMQTISLEERLQRDESPLLRVEGLKVHFPIKKGLLRRTVDSVKAVDGVDLSIPKGQILALVGESGCGKTTLGRTILQLQPSTEGKILFDGQNLAGLSRGAMRPLRKRLQVIFQDPASSLNPRLSIAATLLEPMKVHRIGHSKEERIALAEQVLEDVHLKREHLWRYPHEFSGGQRQRIGVARALCLGPEFIVCDEITSALDVSVQAEILQMLLELRAVRDLTLLFITHNIGVVEYLSDKTAVMHQGKIVEYGATQQVCHAPENPYTQALIRAVPRLKLRRR